MKDDFISAVAGASLAQKLYYITRTVQTINTERSKGVPYRIVTFNEVNNKVREALKDWRVLIVPKVTNHEKNGKETIVTMSADIINVDKPDDRMTVDGYVGYGIDNSDKGSGKAISYAYKYLLMKLFLMDIGDDEESEHSNPVNTINNKTLGKVEEDDDLD